MSDYAWQCDKSLTECMKHVLSRGLFCDVTLLVGPREEEVHAHKLVLVSRSPVFYASFEGPLAERGPLVITDIEKDTFELFLYYLYTDSITLTNENVTSILYCARKYCVDKLTWKCEIFMENKIDAENVFGIMEEAHTYGLTALKEKCLKYLIQNIEEALVSESFTFICNQCIEAILRMDSMNISEEKLFEHVIRWAAAECSRRHLPVDDTNKRLVLGQNIKLIRFPVMADSYFKERVASGMLLDADEVINVFLYNFSKNDGGFGETSFEVASRCYRRVLRFRKTLRERQASDEKNEIAFESSIPSTLHGVTVYTPKEEYETQIVSVDVFDHNKSSIASVDSHYYEHSSHKLHDVFLNQPIRLCPNKRYTIMTKNSYWVKSFYGTRGKSSVPFRDGTLSFYNAALSDESDSDYDWASTTVDKGQIAGLLLS